MGASVVMIIGAGNFFRYVDDWPSFPDPPLQHFDIADLRVTKPEQQGLRISHESWKGFGKRKKRIDRK